jgi:ubiquinone/menaquinone biosynthesis C-methylase UbiE
MNKPFIPAAHYPILTPYFEEIARPFAGRIWKKITAEAVRRAAKNSHVVDLGCGTGIALRLIRKNRPDLNLAGFDIDHTIIHVARMKAEKLNIFFAKAPIDEVPIPDRSADVVLSSLVFHHLDREMKKNALREIRRILKPGKPFLLCDFSVPTKPWLGKVVASFSRSEPDIIHQLDGQLFQVAQEAGATIETLWTLYGCISLHILTFD